MLQSLWSASSGMNAQQVAMDNVANNMANVNTAGFKKSRTDFQDLLYSQIREPGQVTRTGQVLANGIQTGSGTRPAATQMLFEQGALQPTGNAADFAISGDGFFELLMSDGSRAYTRDGSFKVDADGYLVTASGHVVNVDDGEGGLLTFTGSVSDIKIDAGGKVFRDEPVLELEAYVFDSPQDLEKTAGGLLRPTENSGEAILLSEMETEEPEEEFDEDGNPVPVPPQPEPQVFYQVILPDGETAYTAMNSFKVDEEGRLVTVSGEYPLEPEVYMELEEEGGQYKAGDILTADSKGIVWVSREAGALQLASFGNPAGLEKAGGNLYRATDNSGAAAPADGVKVVQGSLEMSNVQISEEMISMIMAQRAYELCSRSIKTSDEMLGMANALLRR